MDEKAILTAAVDAAEAVIFDRYQKSEIIDMDITVKFENYELEVDVYLNVPTADDEDAVARDAALAAQGAVDEIMKKHQFCD